MTSASKILGLQFWKPKINEINILKTKRNSSNENFVKLVTLMLKTLKRNISFLGDIKKNHVQIQDQKTKVRKLLKSKTQLKMKT